MNVTLLIAEKLDIMSILVSMGKKCFLPFFIKIRDMIKNKMPYSLSTLITTHYFV
jgi:hypothetical protein